MTYIVCKNCHKSKRPDYFRDFKTDNGISYKSKVCRSCMSAMRKPYRDEKRRKEREELEKHRNNSQLVHLNSFLYPNVRIL